jgi:hypothetical protein
MRRWVVRPAAVKVVVVVVTMEKCTYCVLLVTLNSDITHGLNVGARALKEAHGPKHAPKKLASN